MILVALAGPGMNLVLALVAALLLAILIALAPTGLMWAFVGQNLLNFMAINIFLAIFNMLPVPPFDGSHVVEGLLPPALAAQYRKLRRFSLLLLIVLLLLLPQLFPAANVVERLVGPPTEWMIRALLPGSSG